VHVEPRRAVRTGEGAAAHQTGQPLGRVTPQHEHPDIDATRPVPLDRDAVRGVVGCDPAPPWQPSGAQVVEPEQADADDGLAIDELGSEAGRKQWGDHPGVGAVVEQQAVDDLAVHLVEHHGSSSITAAQDRR
jgi:hypothetical protein